MMEELIPPMGDSLMQADFFLPADSIAQATSSALPPVEAAEVFGPTSFVDLSAPGGGYLTGGADFPLFQSFVLLLGILYVFFLYDHLGDIYTLFGRHTRSQRLFESRGGYNRFFVTALVILILLCGLLAVRLLPPQTVAALSAFDSLLLALPAATLFFGVGLFQYGVIRAVGQLTLSQDVAEGLIHLKTLVYTAFATFCTPFVFLFVLTPAGSGSLWIVLIAVVGALLLALLLRESLMLFLSKKISILHWFLYLCTVEIFPLSLLWLIATRSHAS